MYTPTRYILAVLFCLWTTSVFPQAGFVKTTDGHFTIDGKSYYYIGANYWYGGLEGNDAKGRQRVRNELDFLFRHGVTNLRILAGAEGTGKINGVDRVKPAFQPAQGAFDEQLLKGLDFLLLEMGKRNMKAVLYLSNNWEWSGGFLQYLNWNGLLPDSIMRRKLNWDEMRDYVSRFYSCVPCMQQYRRQADKIINRVNSITRKRYIEDATIMSWELANEPRPMRPSADAAYFEWIKSVAAHIKSMDKNHLVTAGCEGEMGTESMPLFEKMHSDSNIDYATIHIWPKNWGWFKDTAIAKDIESVNRQTVSYIDKHNVVAKKINKPLVIEEFGLPRDGHSFQLSSSTRLRDQYYKTIFHKLLSAASQQGVIAGCNFWTFSGMGRPSGKDLFWKEGDDLLGDPPQEEQGLNSVFDSDAATWKLIDSYSTQIKKANGVAKNK
jgi:mannan endo-1,4-beta-mannosidase